MPHVENHRIVVTASEARAGVTGHNVRYVLLFGTLGVIALFAGVYPDFEKSFMAAINMSLGAGQGQVVPALQPQVRYQFLNGGRTSGFILNQAGIIFHTTEYDTFEAFLAACVTGLRIVHKRALAGHHPAANVRLTPAELTILQNWLAVRYRRSSFANEFDRRIKDKSAKFYDKFLKIIKATGTNLFMVLFDVDSGQEVNRSGADDTYSLSVYLVFNVEEDPAKAEAAARSAAKEIDALFRSCFLVSGKWQNIELRDCEPISEAAMTVHTASLLKPWNFDYLSLREDPQGPIAAT